MNIAYINLVNTRGQERKVESIERGDGNMSDAGKKDQALRFQEIKFRKKIANGCRLRLYNSKGQLEIESE
jgi:hypothetical protein